LDVINHAGFVVFFAGCGKPTTRCPCDWLLTAIVTFGDFPMPSGDSYREAFSRALGEEDGRTFAALFPPTNLPDASNTEYPVCLPDAS